MRMEPVEAQKKVRRSWPVYAAALFVFLFCCLFSTRVLDGIPHINDEIGYLFQAKIFKTARLTAESPCASEFFTFPHIINNGRWYSQYPPGQPLLLLIGLLLGAPWIINPLLGAGTIILIFLVGRELFGHRTAVLASILGASSIWMLLMSSTMMAHTGCMFFLLLFLHFILQSVKKKGWGNALAAGLAWGMGFLIRPYSAGLVAFPVVLFYIHRLWPRRRETWKFVAALGFAALSMVCVLLAYNLKTNGHPLRMGYSVRYGEAHGMGFGRSGFTDFEHTPMLGAANSWNHIKDMNRHLFGWPFSSFLALLPLLAFGRLGTRDREAVLLLAGCWGVLIVGYYFYWATSVLVGARFYFEAVPGLILLSARGLVLLSKRMSGDGGAVRITRIRGIGAFILILFTVHAFGIRLPDWLHPPGNQWVYERINTDFQGTSRGIERIRDHLLPEKAVVVMKSLYHPFEYFPGYWWRSGFILNDPDLENRVVFAGYGDGGLEKLMRCLPKRSFYLLTGTVEKGILVPLDLAGGETVFGTPISLEEETRRDFRILSRPQDFFTVYSPEFRAFLDDLIARNRIDRIDVAFLFRLGREKKNSKQLQTAKFCFEAALQIEKQPKIRRRLLNQLAPCYLRTGEREAALRIFSRLEDLDDSRLFDLFPERGF